MTNLAFKLQARSHLGDIDGEVGEDDDHGRDVVGEEGNEQAATSPGNDVRNEDGDGEGVTPDREHGALDAKRSLRRAVAERQRDGPATVDADRAEVPDGRGAQRQVHALPGLEERDAERPAVVVHLYRQPQRHRQYGREEVGESQRDEEIVDDRLEFFGVGENDEDNEVAEERDDDEKRQGHRGENVVKIDRGSVRCVRHHCRRVSSCKFAFSKEEFRSGARTRCVAEEMRREWRERRWSPRVFVVRQQADN